MITHDPLWVWSFHRIHSNVHNKTGSITKQSHFRHTSHKCLATKLAKTFDSRRNGVFFCKELEWFAKVSLTWKCSELGNVFGTSIFCSETFYRCKRNEIFIRSGIESYEQWLRGSFISIAQCLELKKLISQSDMPRILLSNGHRKICSVRVEMSVSWSRMVVRKWNLE